MSHSDAAERAVPGAMADRPRDIPLKGWVQITKRAFKEMAQDHLTLIAGGVAYAWFLALFPGLIAAVLIYGLVTDPAEVQSQVASFASALPNNAQELLTNQMEKIAAGGSGLSVGVVLSIALALWSASAGIAGLIEAINVAYDEQEERNFAKKRGLAILLTIGFLIFIALAVGVVAVVPIVLDKIGLGIVAKLFISVGRFLALLVIMLVALAMLYRIGPDRDAPKIRWASPGAVIATILWIVASVAFSVYVNNFSSYDKTYGSLGAVMVLLLWLWITALVVLLGAEINAESEAQTAKDTTKGPAEPMGSRGAVKADQPPPRP